MGKRFLKLVVGFGLAFVLGWGVQHIFGRPIRYEFPAEFKGWATVQFEDPACPPLRRLGIFLVVSVPVSGRACTSTHRPNGWIYYRFEYVYPDGKREALRWNDHGRPGTQVWLVGYRPEDKSYEVFVGDEHANW